MAEGSGKQWLKYTLFGCMGCFGLIVLVLAVTIGSAWMRARSEKVEDKVLTHPAPAAPVREPREPAPTRTSTEEIPAQAPGTVVLDLKDAAFHLNPGDAGDPIRVNASYDQNSYELTEHSERAEDGTWIYRVEFRRTTDSSWWMDLIQSVFSGTTPEVRITLPPGTPIALETKVERGGMEADLGGLYLTTVDFQVAMGGLELRVSEPLAQPLERFDLKTEMGGAEFVSIGNASPRVLNVEYRMGGMELDLRGAWTNDTEITLRGSMGGAEVRLPTEVRIEGVPGRKFEGPTTKETNVPTLRFNTSSDMGEVEFRQ